MKFAEGGRKTLLRVACFWAPILWGICLSVPVRNDYLRLLMLTLPAVSLLGWLCATWSRPVVRYGLMAFLAALIGLFCLPERDSLSCDSLSQSYAASLRKYEGTTYHWGGETRTGIDCSGLIRAAMEDATFWEGLKRGDGRLIRHAANLWLHDESAQALGEGYRKLTVPVCLAKNLNELDYTVLKVGDLAIAGGGVHILAYLGDHRWIQADPGADKVIIEQAPSKNCWFSGAVKIVRWTLLQNGCLAET